MKTRTNISALVSALSVVAVGGSVLAGQPTANVKPQVISSKYVQVEIIPAPYNPDYNRSGVVDTVDIFDYLTGWFAGKSDCDVDGNGVLDGMDILNFINAWLTSGVSGK